jgi:hypothetical protein
MIDELMNRMRRILNKPPRTLPQNKFYHGIVVPMVTQRMVELGHSLEDENGFPIPFDRKKTHEFLKRTFNSGKSTTKLSVKEFTLYVETIVQWAADSLDLVITDPT